MTRDFHHTIPIQTLKTKPGIQLWYAGIPAIINTFFPNRFTDISKPKLNQRFSISDFSIPCFSLDEIEALNRFKAFKKQLEWMAGRYLIKQMIRHCFLPDTDTDQIVLDYQDHGAPFVVGHPQLSFSISHSGSFTVAACSLDPNRTLGVDIETVRKTPDPAFLKTAFTQREIDHMDGSARQVFTLWTLKEAYLKYIKEGFNESLKKVEIIGDSVFHHQLKIELDIFSFTLEDNNYIISLVTD